MPIIEDLEILEEEESDLYEESLTAKAARRQRRRKNAAHKTLMSERFTHDMKPEERKELILGTIDYKKWCWNCSAHYKWKLDLKYKGETRKGIYDGACNDRLTKSWKNYGVVNEITKGGCHEGPAAYGRWYSTF